MSREECLALLSRHHIGRLAFTFQDCVDIRPLKYVMIGDDLVFRTVYGTKVEALKRNPWVAFEVDEIDRPDVWYSVVVRGTIYPVEDIGNADEQHAFTKALDSLGLDREVVADGSDVLLLRLHTDNMTGREARVGEAPATCLLRTTRGTTGTKCPAKNQDLARTAITVRTTNTPRTTNIPAIRSTCSVASSGSRLR